MAIPSYDRPGRTPYEYDGNGIIKQTFIGTGCMNGANTVIRTPIDELDNNDPDTLKCIIADLGREIDGLRDRINTAVNALLNKPTEIRDGKDDDCNGTVDEYAPNDPNATMCSTMPGGKDDQSSKEVCNGLDDDCDGDGTPCACDNCPEEKK